MHSIGAEDEEVNIFIVDDSQLFQERLVSLLAKIESAKIVGQAFDVSTAVEGINATEPDVVFLDIRMPDGNGFEVLNRIKPAAKKIIILTNYTFQQYRTKAKEMGVHYFLNKDQDFTKISGIVGEIAQSKPVLN